MEAGSSKTGKAAKQIYKNKTKKKKKKKFFKYMKSAHQGPTKNFEQTSKSRGLHSLPVRVLIELFLAINTGSGENIQSVGPADKILKTLIMAALWYLDRL